MPLSRSRHSDPGRHATRTMPGACHTKAWKQGGTEMKAMGILVRYGYAVVFGTVLAEQIGLPIPAIPVMLAAGALVGGRIWASAFMAIGWVFTNQIEMIGGYIARLGSWILALVVVAFGGYIGAKYISRRRFLRKMRITRITPEELKTKLDGGEEMIVVDVRDRIDFDAEPAIIPGALHLTTEELEARHQEIPREREIVLYCTCPSEETS